MSLEHATHPAGKAKPDYRDTLLAFGWRDFLLAYKQTKASNRMRFIREVRSVLQRCDANLAGNFWYNDGVLWCMDYFLEHLGVPEFVPRSAIDTDIYRTVHWKFFYGPGRNGTNNDGTSTCDYCGEEFSKSGKSGDVLIVTGVMIQDKFLCSPACLDDYRKLVYKRAHLNVLENLTAYPPQFTVESVLKIIDLPSVKSSSGPIKFPAELTKIKIKHGIHNHQPEAKPAS